MTVFLLYVYSVDAEYDFGDRCTWILQAPRNKYIDAWFDGPLYLASFGQGYSPCQHWVEIKEEGRHAPQGPRYVVVWAYWYKMCI